MHACMFVYHCRPDNIRQYCMHMCMCVYVYACKQAIVNHMQYVYVCVCVRICMHACDRVSHVGSCTRILPITCIAEKLGQSLDITATHTTEPSWLLAEWHGSCARAAHAICDSSSRENLFTAFRFPKQSHDNWANSGPFTCSCCIECTPC
jgi:hypothetical protein